MAIDALEELKRRDQWVAYSRSKIPVSPKGRAASSTDPESWGSLEEAKYIRKVQGLPGVGFVFSADDPYVGIDLDDAIDPVTDSLKPWAQEIIDRIDSYTEFSPSGLGVHIWVRASLPRNGARTRDGQKVEAYKQARYFTVTGKHVPGTPERIEERDLEGWFADVFGEEKPPTPPRDGAWEAPGVENWLGEALTYLNADDYHEWIRVGMAIKAELGDRGFAFFDRWSASSSKYGGTHKVEKKWKSFGYEGSVTIGTIVWLAEQHGFSVPRSAALPSSMDGDWDDWLGAQTGVGGGGVDGGGLEIVLHDVVDLYLDRTPFEPDLVGPGLLSAGDMMLLFGPPKSMKSMVIMDMFRNFALGRAWCGFEPQRPLRTLYAQFEVKADKMRQRLQLASMSREDAEAMRGMLMITERFTPVMSAEFVIQFTELALKTFPSGLDVLVLDPLANIYTGESENDNAQMGRFIRQLKILRNAINPDVAIVLVHHSSKMSREDRHGDPFNSGRGASALRGAYDSGVYLDRLDEESDLIKMWTELRNGPRRAPTLLEFSAGVFRESSAGDQQDFDLGDLAEADPERLEFERLLREEAAAGRFYTSATFAETFEGDEIGSAATIKRHLSRLATRGALGWFRSVGDAWLPEPHHRSTGYLCCRHMVLLFDGRLHEVVPQQMKDARSGVIRNVVGWPA